ncbi:MAG TPA: polysaccharide deacetylase family protein [Candidatus Omnitrophota bacterium]|nr:polysaccharide deacetylase family protein [Candidatus Omnitrophota bacterium]HSA30998.1 polysaccharide deacetylase family protein [Candidatus Omnitrophota bacterium]
MKKLSLVVVLCAALVAGLLSSYQFWLKPRYVVPILMYHYLGEGAGSLYVSAENFDRQMAYLKDRHYRVIPLEELADGIEQGRAFERKTVVITFDDGTEDNYTLGLPIFKKYGYPVTIFIQTQNMDGVYENKHLLSWPQVREMVLGGVSFGSHTRRHAYLPHLSEEQLRDEIIGSKKDLDEQLGPAARFLCYPVGGFTEQAKRIAQEAGFRGALTTNRGMQRSNKDLFELKRIKVKDHDLKQPFSFALKLSGYYNLFRSLKPGH